MLALPARGLIDSRPRALARVEYPVVHIPYVSDRAEVATAAELILKYGDDAGYEAAARADRSRDLGNHLHFARWRQIERLVVLLSIPRAVGTVH